MRVWSTKSTRGWEGRRETVGWDTDIRSRGACVSAPVLQRLPSSFGNTAIMLYIKYVRIEVWQEV
jgi:hypothetical protein